MSASPCGVENAAIVASYRCRVAEHYWVNQRYKYIRLEADAPIARITKAGQFYQLKCPTTLEHEPVLLRPMSVYGAGPEDNRIEFLYNVTGVGTKAMATLLEGGHMDIVGPLGNPLYAALAKGINVLNGVVTYEAVAEAFGLPYQPWQAVA